MSFTAVHIAEFPVVAWQRASPELQTQACVVLEGVAPQERVVSLCAKARAAGVAHGMSKVQAEAGCVANFRAREIEEEKRAFAALLEHAERFSPRVEGISSPLNAYAEAQRLAVVLLIDSSGIGTLFGSAESYAEKLYLELRPAGFPAGVGAAPNAEAALMLARSTQGVVCADRDSVRGKLAWLPVALLPCEAKLLGMLHRWGIRTLGELAALPEAALVSRLGQQGHRLQRLARGEADHLLVPEEAEFTLAETVSLDTPVELLDSLLFVLSPMLEALLAKAMNRAYALRSIRLTLQLERSEPHTLEVRLEAEPTQPQTAQRGLFQAQFPDPDKLELLLARLRSIAGEGNVGSPQLMNTHAEDAFTMAPFQPSVHTNPRKPAGSQLALRRLRLPHAARVTCWADRPCVLFWQDVKFTIASSAGPWHSSGSWWDGEVWDHDCWDVVTETPVQALRLRQEHASKAWFVVGFYD